MPKTKIQSENLQRAITPKIAGIELWFLFTALLYNVTYLCMKFEVNSFNTFEVMPRRRFRDAQMDARTDIRTYGQGDFIYGGINMGIIMTLWIGNGAVLKSSSQWQLN